MEFVSHKNEVLAELERKAEKALTECGLYAEIQAEDYAAPRDTGLLANSITSNADSSVMVVGTNTEYAIYVELGTGVYASGGRPTPWAFQDSKGEWHRTRGIKPRHFIKRAISEHGKAYINIINDTLKG